MLTRFETKSSSRVKGLSFHSKRPWILASLHSGSIQIWDYGTGALIDRFDHEHDGPVRGVHFHKSQPLFVSGGDDHKVKVWNHNLRRCLYTLRGHLDYIRTVQFHHELPWIVSASDDRTVRIWNWQSRTCISVLSGHGHYVMCASFHPRDDLVVSASLDRTVRVWDITALRQKVPLQSNGVNVVAVKHVLEGHDGGVNWAAFHSTLPLIVSGADDCQVKLWRTNDTKAWEVDTLSGHMKNVSCVMFHPKQDILVSSSEDKSIRIWNATKRIELQTHRRENDQFWILAAHPETNLLAAGHDTGMVVFKLERERPAFSTSGGSLIYTMDGAFLHFFDYSSQRNRAIPIGLNRSPRTVSCSPAEKAVLLWSDADGGSYELYIVQKDSVSKRDDTVQEAKRDAGSSAIFIARNRFAVLDRTSNQVLIKSLQNEVVKTISLPIATTDAIFHAGTGNLLCRSEDRIVLFDLRNSLIVGEFVTVTPFVVKYVAWSNDMESVALLSKQAVVIANKTLVHQCTLQETVRVKSAAWDNDNGVLIYTTSNHIKYCLQNGDSGIIRTVDVPVYITKVSGNSIFCLGRDGSNRTFHIDSTEYMFKLSLLQKRYDICKSSKLCGNAMVGYLQQKGFPEIALHFEKDERTRFDLALASGEIQIAAASAKQIDEKDHWYRLGVEALRQGNAGIVEDAYERTKNYSRLSFLYLITGKLEKLEKMMKIMEDKNDVMGQFHNALYLGDVQERVKILENAGHEPLAYVTAKLHGLEEVAERLRDYLGDKVPSLPVGNSPYLLMPPSPIISSGDWPLLEGGVEEDEEAADTPATSVNGNNSSVYVAPKVGLAVSQVWTRRSLLAAEHVAAGNFGIAMMLLYRQLGIENFSPLKSRFLEIHAASRSYLPAVSATSAISLAVGRDLNARPALVFSIAKLEQELKAGYRATTSGKLTEAVKLFLSILRTIPLIVVESRKEVDRVKELIVGAREYVVALKMELERREIKDDPVRVQELAAYFTHCNLQTPHLRLALQNAMSICYKAKNCATAVDFARRLMEIDPLENQAKVARSVLRAVEKDMTVADATPLNYDSRNPFVVCGATYLPIYRGQKDVSCPYCSARFVPSQEGEVCAVCDLGAVGEDASGLHCLSSQA